MAALASDRHTPSRSGKSRSFPVKGATRIHAGALVAVTAAGLAVPGSTSATLKGVGRAEARVDNSAGGDGAARIEVGAEIYRFDNSAGADEITAGSIGDPAFIVDDHTVAKTDGTGTRSKAGTVFDVDGIGVWVAFA